MSQDKKYKSLVRQSSLRGSIAKIIDSIDELTTTEIESVLLDYITTINTTRLEEQNKV